MTNEESLAHHEVEEDKGLSTEDAAKRLENYGKNMLTPPPQEHECIKFMRHLTGFFSLLLWFGSVLCFISYSLDNSSQDNVGKLLIKHFELPILTYIPLLGDIALSWSCVGCCGVLDGLFLVLSRRQVS